jgi:hypothetical protein
MSALVLTFGVILGSCATYATRDGVITPLGSLTSPAINASRTVIAEYAIILGLITDGYEKFLEETKGKDVDIIDVNYLNLYRKIQAVTRE